METEIERRIDVIDPKSKAVNSLIFGVISYVVPVLGLALAIMAIIYGNVALKVIASDQPLAEGKAMALSGKILGIINIALTIVGVIGLSVWMIYVGLNF